MIIHLLLLFNENSDNIHEFNVFLIVTGSGEDASEVSESSDHANRYDDRQNEQYIDDVYIIQDEEPENSGYF